ncbi:competence protein CoiA [Streptomyces sp. NPDC059340]|uniref:competence protein CoiA n=1 Tax=Streptomyces sp. NPDC059340 TaxID=3346806 RepID=UPI00368A8676
MAVGGFTLATNEFLPVGLLSDVTCPECRGRVFARISQYRLRHFYHQVRPPDCELANESAEHHLLKLELAMAARAAGWSSELEVSSQSRDWRADVMVYDERGQPFMALEAQLSPMTADEAQMRTDRYVRDGVTVCWILTCAGSPLSLSCQDPTQLLRRIQPDVVDAGLDAGCRSGTRVDKPPSV